MNTDEINEVFFSIRKKDNEAPWTKEGERVATLFNTLEVKKGKDVDRAMYDVWDLYREARSKVEWIILDGGEELNNWEDKAQIYNRINNFLSNADYLTIDVQGGLVVDAVSGKKKKEKAPDSRIKNSNERTDNESPESWYVIFRNIQGCYLARDISFVWEYPDVTLTYWRGSDRFEAISKTIKRLLDVWLKDGHARQGDKRKGCYKPVADALRPLFIYLKDNCQAPESPYETNIIWIEFLVKLFSIPEHFKDKLPRYLTRNS